MEDQESEATNKKTRSDVNQFHSFLRSCTNKTRNIEEIPPDQLDKLFGDFLLGARKAKDHTEYEPSTLRGFVGSLDRYLMRKGAPYKVLKNPAFPHINNSLVAKQKHLKGQGMGNKPNEADELTDSDIDILFSEGLLGVHKPLPLINLLHLNFSLVLDMRGGKEQWQLKWGDICLESDEDGDEYLVHHRERTTKTRTGQDTRNVRKFKPKVWINEDKERCPVNAYKIYASKRPEQMNHPDAPFFLSINMHDPREDSAWFKNSPMGINSIYGLTKSMKQKSKLLDESRKVTNHSIRKHQLQKCVDINLPPTETVQMSGHRNLQSVNNYSKMNQNKQKAVSKMLTNTESTNTSQQQLTLPQQDVVIPSRSSIPVPLAPRPATATANFQQQQAFSSYFGGTTNMHGCTFIFNAPPQQHVPISIASSNSMSPQRKYRRILPISDSDSE